MTSETYLPSISEETNKIESPEESGEKRRTYSEATASGLQFFFHIFENYLKIFVKFTYHPIDKFIEFDFEVNLIENEADEVFI